MVNYRRNFVPGGTFFFTVTLADRRSKALVDHIDPLRNALRVARRERPFAARNHPRREWCVPKIAFAKPPSYRSVNEGILPDDWAGDAVQDNGANFGERE